MMEELFALKWKNHCSAFLNLLGTIREKEMFVDVTLACSGKFYGAHKMVLTACSDYFKEIFAYTDCKKPVIVLSDIEGHTLEALLDYMYLGVVTVKQGNLSSLIKAAECLQIKGLDASMEESDTLADSPGISPTNTVTRSKKRKVCETFNQDMPQPKIVKGHRKNIDSLSIVGATEVPISKEEFFPDSDPIFIKEEFLDTDSVIIEDASSFQSPEKNTEDVLITSPYTDEASTSHLKLNESHSELGEISEVISCQDNSGNDSTLTKTGNNSILDFSTDYGPVDSGSQPSGGTFFDNKTCSTCGRIFQTPSKLQRHLLVHSGEKPHACELCDYRCSQKPHLKVHMFGKHGLSYHGVAGYVQE